MTKIDPTTYRISEHIMLSDLVGCDSVYRLGYANPVYEADEEKLREGKHLARTLLEPLMAEFGTASFAYGYISPDLSRKIVKYQDPDKPSYHRWDFGAAVDVCFHDWVNQGISAPPVHLAHDIDSDYEYSRMITYAESPYICLATKVCELRARKAFYENRYEGTPRAKPLYIQKRGTERAKKPDLTVDWRGAGYPTYHSGGKMEFNHERLGPDSFLSDFLYSRNGVHSGVKNNPDPRNTRFTMIATQAAEAYSMAVDALDVPRLSIVRAYECPRTFKNMGFGWENNYIFEVVPPESLTLDDVADTFRAIGTTVSVKTSKERNRVRVVGFTND